MIRKSFIEKLETISKELTEETKHFENDLTDKESDELDHALFQIYLGLSSISNSIEMITTYKERGGG